MVFSLFLSFQSILYIFTFFGVICSKKFFATWIEFPLLSRPSSTPDGYGIANTLPPNRDTTARLLPNCNDFAAKMLPHCYQIPIILQPVFRQISNKADKKLQLQCYQITTRLPTHRYQIVTLPLHCYHIATIFSSNCQQIWYQSVGDLMVMSSLCSGILVRI